MPISEISDSATDSDWRIGQFPLLRPQTLQLRQLSVKVLVYTALFLLLADQKALLLQHAFVIFLNLAAQFQGCLGRIAAVKLQLLVQRLALLAQLHDALCGRTAHLLHQHQRRTALGAVRGRIRVARQQHALAPALFQCAAALFLCLEPLGFLRSALMVGQGRANDASHCAGRAQFALFAVNASRDGAIGRELAPLSVCAGVDAAAGLRRRLLRKGTRAQHGGQQHTGQGGRAVLAAALGGCHARGPALSTP